MTQPGILYPRFYTFFYPKGFNRFWGGREHPTDTSLPDLLDSPNLLYNESEGWLNYFTNRFLKDETYSNYDK